MNQGFGPALFEQALDLGVAGDDLAGLGGHRQRLAAASLQQGLGIGGKGGRNPNVALEPTAEMVTPDRFRNGPARRTDPQAAAGQFALQIGNDLARRGDHEPDQLIDRSHLAADRAHPHGRGLAGPRPARTDPQLDSTVLAAVIAATAGSLPGLELAEPLRLGAAAATGAVLAWVARQG